MQPTGVCFQYNNLAQLPVRNDFSAGAIKLPMGKSTKLR